MAELVHTRCAKELPVGLFKNQSKDDISESLKRRNKTTLNLDIKLRDKRFPAHPYYYIKCNLKTGIAHFNVKLAPFTTCQFFPLVIYWVCWVSCLLEKNASVE